MPSDYFSIKVTVDGEVIPTCHAGNSNCRYRPYTSYTPTITEISPSSGPPGTLLTMRGQIYTSKYGMNASTNGDADDVARVTAGGDLCEIASSNGQSNGIVLDGSGESNNGVLTCRLSESGSQIGNLNVSYTLTARGRSKTNLNLYRVSRNGQIFMFQSYAEINSVTPSFGSSEGGTVITISGNYFDQTRSEAVVKVGDTRCHVITINATTIMCKTARKPETTNGLYPGNRGFIVESWKDTLESNLTMVKNLNESAPDYQTTFSDTTHIPGYNTSSNYVNRMRGFFFPPFDGEYQFVIASAAGVQFYLSSDTDPANLKLELDKYTRTTATSRAILLHSNQSYYMEVFYRQSTSSTAVNVAVRYLDSIVNHHMAGNVQQEQQLIHFWTYFENEKQRITIPDIINQTAVHEQQEIIVDADEGRFRLGMYGVYTEILFVGASEIDLRNALQALPVFDASETVSVNMTSHGEGFKYTVTFISERGSFPLLEIRNLAEYISIEILKTRDGRPSGKKIGLFMAGTPAPLIDSDPSQAQVEDAIDQLFTARCPAYWTEPKKSVLYYNMDDSSSIPTYMRRYWINDNCFMLQKKQFCVALKGDANRINMYVDYVDVNGKRKTLSQNFYDIIKAKNTEQWNYGCYNLREHITAIIAGATQLVLRRFRIYGADFLLDELYFGQQATTLDTDDAHLRRLVCSPNGYRIVDVDVTNSQNSFDVSLTSAHAGHGFPLFAVDETQVPPDTNISFTRITSATTPISGTFDLTLRGQTLKSIPVDIRTDDLNAILEQFDDVGVVKSGGSNLPFDRYLWFTFDTYAGNLEQIHINATLLGGINATASTYTDRNGEYRIDPLYGEMLQTANDKPQ
ncbi:fibrocystin-L-like, partial [Mizuhopecten yessoensis]|uniref:fibrocystin-L-like n=1 Tax=Mizuhopecten yessoensis TaxID=6573 RepID=UPI000B45B4EA